MSSCLRLRYHSVFKYAVRPDGRRFNEYRKLAIQTDVVTTSTASSLVRLGNTAALCAVKLEVTIPPNERPLQGELRVNIEMPPMCSPEIRPGRLIEESCSLTAEIDTLLRSCIDTSQLCIKPAKAAWMIYVDVYVLDSDGSLLDAILQSIFSSLEKVSLPPIAINDEGNIQRSLNDGNAAFDNSNGEPLKFNHFPISSTCILLENQLVLVDPTNEEENILGSSISTIVDENDSLLKMKVGGCSSLLLPESIRRCHETAKMRAKEVRGFVSKIQSDEAS